MRRSRIAGSISLKQFIAVLFLLCSFSNAARTQVRWQIAKVFPMSSAYERCLSCNRNSCTAIVVNLSGEIVFWRSDDQGLSWIEQDPGLPYRASGSSKGYLWALQQIDSLHVIAFGDSGRIVTTGDAGRTWQIDSSPVSFQLTAGSCQDAQHGITVGQFSNKVLINEGNAWRIAPFASYTSDYQVPPTCYAGANGTYRIVTGQRNTDSLTTYRVELFRTKDSWQSVDSIAVLSWSTRDTLFKSFPFTTNFSESGDTIIIAGTQVLTTYAKGRSIIARSFDGGDHWQTFIDSSNALKGFWGTRRAGRTLYSLLRSDSISSTSSLYVSRDDGATWHIEEVGFPDSIGPFRILAFVPAMTADGSIVAKFHIVTATDVRLNLIARTAPFVAGVITAADVSRVPYPNPATTELHLESAKHVVIVDALGRIRLVSHGENTIDISTLPAGVYYLEDGEHPSKFVKK